MFLWYLCLKSLQRIPILNPLQVRPYQLRPLGDRAVRVSAEKTWIESVRFLFYTSHTLVASSYCLFFDSSKWQDLMSQETHTHSSQRELFKVWWNHTQKPYNWILESINRWFYPLSVSSTRKAWRSQIRVGGTNIGLQQRASSRGPDSEVQSRLNEDSRRIQDLISICNCSLLNNRKLITSR